jgi:hypothetical protein
MRACSPVGNPGTAVPGVAVDTSLAGLPMWWPVIPAAWLGSTARPAVDSSAR